jgi:hypothetical protein
MVATAHEAGLIESLRSNVSERDRGDQLDALLGALLVEHCGLVGRPTDGLLLRREELRTDSYFATGTLVLIEDQSPHPVCLQLSWSSPTSLAEGSWVRAGVAPGSHYASKAYRRLEALLLASPHEVTSELEWACVFRRSAEDWQLEGAWSHAPSKGRTTTR